MRARCSDAGSVILRSLMFGICLCLIASGCSVRLAYNNADRLAVWQAGEYVDLDRAQKRWLRARMQVFLYWHRTNQLPRWSATLREFDLALQDQVSGDYLDGDYLDTLYGRAELWYDEMLVQLEPTAVELLLSLSDDQVADLPEAFETRNAELNEDYAGLAPQAQREVWRREMEDALDTWIGELNPAQTLLLDAVSTEVVPDNAAWIGYRERWQAGLMAALLRRQEPGVLAQAFAQLVRDREAYFTPEYAEVRARNDQVYRDFTLRLLATLDERQQQRLSERLQDLAEDFAALAQAAGAPPEDPGPAPRG